jgi:hypothetical protein
MGPEAHGAQVLPDPDYRPKNMICPPLKQNIIYVFSHKYQFLTFPTTFVL